MQEIGSLKKDSDAPNHARLQIGKMKPTWTLSGKACEGQLKWPLQTYQKQKKNCRLGCRVVKDMEVDEVVNAILIPVFSGIDQPS